MFWILLGRARSSVAAEAHLVRQHGRTRFGNEVPMRLTTASIVGAILTVFASSALGQVTPACLVRGSQQWLATRPSPLDSVTVTVGGTTAKICYSRPSARGRSVDSLVPPGPAWRMGANEPTTITLTDSLSVGGALLPSGRYVILGVPGLDRWTVVFYTTPHTDPVKMFQNLEQVATGSGEVERMVEALEQFTIRSECEKAKCDLLLEWGTWRVRIPVQVAS